MLSTFVCSAAKLTRAMLVIVEVIILKANNHQIESLFLKHLSLVKVKSVARFSQNREMTT